MVGACIVPIQLVHLDFSFMPGDLGDARFNNYVLEHGYRWLSVSEQSFWNAPFFYPAPNVISYSDNHLGTLPIYALFRFIKFDREMAFQLWMMVIFALNYFSCAWVLHKFHINGIGTAIGSFIFAFSMPVVASLGHIQVLPRFMIPLAFYFFFRFLEKKDNKSLVLSSLSVVYQFYCTIYMGMFLILGLAFLMLAYARINRSGLALGEITAGPTSSIVVPVAVASLSLVLLLPLMLPYYKTSQELGMRHWGSISCLLPRVQSYLLPAEGSLLWNWLVPLKDTFTGQTLRHQVEHHLFIGIIPLLAIVYLPFMHRRHREEPLLHTGMIFFLALTICFLSTLFIGNSHGNSLYQIVSYLPGFRSIRAIVRIMLMNLFFIAVIAGVVVSRISDLFQARSKRIAVIVFTFVLMCGVVLDQYVRPGYCYSKSDAIARSSMVEKLVLKKNPSSKVFIFMPVFKEEPYLIHLDAMLAAQNLNMATVNGYSGNFPPRYFAEFYENYSRCESLLKWKTFAMQQYGVNPFTGLVIVGGPECTESVHPN